MLTRVLFIWMFKHQSSGYVQGINDLAATLMLVFVSEKVKDFKLSLQHVEELDDESILDIECETYYCLENLTESIQTNYTDGQTGIYQIIETV